MIQSRPYSASILPLLCLAGLALGVDPRYHHYEQTAAELRQLAGQYLALCRLETLGFSTTNNWPLLCLKLSDHPDRAEDEPHILFNGVHHACELIGDEICLFMAHDLLSRYGSDSSVTRWVDSNQISLVPLVNPDGHEINVTGLDSMWRKNLHRFNHRGVWDPDSDGVDLNRNYDFLWQLGDSNVGNRYYRGAAPFSENETRMIRDLAQREKFVFDVCFHSDSLSQNGEEVYYPWRWGNGFCPDYPEIKTVCDSVARRTKVDSGPRWYASVYGRASDGGMARNWLYHALGTFSYTMEVSHGYQPPGYRVDSICRRVCDGVYYLLDRTHGSGVTGHVKDAVTGLPLVAQVAVFGATSTPDTILPRMSDSLYGRFWHVLRPSICTIEVSRRGYYTQIIPDVVVESDRMTVVDVALSRTPAVVENEAEAPGLRLAAPGGWSGTVKVSYEIPVQGFARLGVYDLTGRLVQELVRRELPAGSYSETWGPCSSGSPNRAGVYFLRLAVGGRTASAKVVIR